MKAPEIVDCRIVRRETSYAGEVVRPQRYAFSEILMTDAAGRHYCSRTWDEIQDSPFARANQIEEFRRRWEAAERIAPHAA